MKYTVSEYARLCNISKAEVYRRINNEWKSIAVKENGTWCIDTDRNNNDNESKTEEVIKDKEEQKPKEETKLEEAQKEIEKLKRELAQEKERTIENEKRILDMMDKVIKLTENTQVLMARTQEQQLLLTDGKTKKSNGIFGWLKRKK